MKIFILCAFACLVNLTSSQSVNATQKRSKRSDDPIALQAVMDQLLQRVGQLEAQTTAIQNDVGQLKTKRCETGSTNLSPHDKTETITGDYHERRHTIHITFARPFAITPWVAVSLRAIDEMSTVNMRIASGTANIGTTGFDLYVYEWADTQIYMSAATWIACTV